MKKILITGFDPFGSEKINPAIEAVKLLPNSILGVEIVKLEIPTIRYKALEAIETAIELENPDVILSIGQAGGRFDITVERVGINIDDFRIGDNAGNQPIDEKVFFDGADAYFSNLPIKAIVQKIQDGKIPASISNTAGTFVCNHVLYGVSYLVNTKFPGKKSGFIHIPFMREQVVNKNNMPFMDIETMAKAITLAVEAIIENPDEDINVTGGATH